jgi:hypothetical protein
MLAFSTCIAECVIIPLNSSRRIPTDAVSRLKNVREVPEVIDVFRRKLHP